MKTYRFLKTLIICILFIGLTFAWKSDVAAQGVSLPVFSDFVAMVKDDQAGIVRGVYVPDVLALPVVQQPEEDPSSVSQMGGVATQFNAAARYNVVGLLAHNSLAGKSFAELKIGEEVRLVYGDGRAEYFTVNRIAEFQALQPEDPYGDFVDLGSQSTYTVQDIFTMFYQGGTHVTFQTCISWDGDASWGRLFVTAVPDPLVKILGQRFSGLDTLLTFGQGMVLSLFGN